MSSASITSSKREKESSELIQELDSVRTLNSGLRRYLEHLQTFRTNLRSVHSNCKQLHKVNNEWIEIIQTMKNQKKGTS